MMAHLHYLAYVLRHKWFVFLACWQIRAPFWASIIHDWSKFTPAEWFPYVWYFYQRPRVPGHEREAPSFDLAWNHHQKANPHHWQYWVLVNDNDDPQVKALPMPERYIREMVADWIGASRAQGHGDDVRAWYKKFENKRILHPETRERVEYLLEAKQYAGGPWRLPRRKAA